MDASEIVSDRQRPFRWLNTDEGHAWGERRAAAFAPMAARHFKLMAKKS